MKPRTYSFLPFVLSTLVLACGGDDGDDAASATDPDPSTGADPSSESGEPATTAESSTGEASTGEPTTGEPTTSEPDTTTGGVPQSCEDATTPEQCAAIDDEYFSCAWYETTTVADPVACAGRASSGVCLLSDQADGCTGSETSCAGSTNSVLVRADRRGGYELVLDGPYCLDGIGDFEPCDEALAMDPGELGQACACACSLLP